MSSSSLSSPYVRHSFPLLLLFKSILLSLPSASRFYRARSSPASRSSPHPQPARPDLVLAPALFGTAIQHVSRPSMETFGSVTKGTVLVQVPPSRGPRRPLRSLRRLSTTVRTQTTQDEADIRKIRHTARHNKESRPKPDFTK